MSLKKFSNTRIKLSIFFFLLILAGFIYKNIYDYQDYSPVIITENSNFNTKTPIDLYQNISAIGVFKAKHDHLGIIGMKFDTHWNINNDYLQFSIKEKGQSDSFYSAKYKVDQINNYKYFPFGFPEIPNSKGKTYEIEIKSLYGHDQNYLTLSPFSDDFIIKYNFTKTYLRNNLKEVPSYLVSKSLSYFYHLSTASWVIIFAASFIFYIFIGTKTGKIFIKYFQYSIKDKHPIDQNNKNIFTFLISIYLLLFITKLILLLKNQSESSEWLIYIISSISIFLLIIYFYFFKKFFSQKLFKIILILGYILLIFRIIYLIFFTNYLGYNYLILLSLSFIPSLIQLKNGPESFLKTLLLQLLIIFSVAGYFFMDMNNFPKQVVVLITIVSPLLALAYKYILKIIPQKNILVTFVSFIIIFLVAIYFTNKPIEYHHYSFYVGPIYELSLGKSILSDVPSQYGYLSIQFIHTLLQPFKINFLSFHILNQILFIVFYLLTFLIIYRITKNNLLTFIFSIIAIFFQTKFSLDSASLAPSTGPLRFGLSLLIILFLTYFPNKISLIFTSIIASISIFWSIETAIYIVPAYIFSLGIFSFIKYSDFKNRLKIFTKYLYIFLASSVLIFGLIVFKEYQYHHSFPPVLNYFQFASAYKNGFGSELIPIFGNYYLVILIMLLGLISVFNQIRNRQSKNLILLSFIVIHNIAIFSYFVSRSNQNNIVNISLFFLIELILLINYISRKINNKYIYTLPISLFISFFFYISYLNISKPNRLHYSNQDIVINQLTLYQPLQEKYHLNESNTLIISKNNDTPLIVENKINTYLPLNPSLMTSLLPNYKEKYLIPNLSKLQIGTTIITSADMADLMEFIEENFILKKVSTDSSDYFSLYTISAIAPPKDN